MNIEDKHIQLLFTDLYQEDLLFKLAPTFAFNQDQNQIEHHLRNNLSPSLLAWTNTAVMAEYI